MTLEEPSQSAANVASGDNLPGWPKTAILRDCAETLRCATLDLPSYTREVMARAEAALGTKLSWVAVDHHDTDNPHTHIVIRDRRANCQDLVLPSDFIQHGFRGIARDVATDWLGRRSPEQERLALDRETRRDGPTRLDALIEPQLDKAGRVPVADLRAPNEDPTLTQALKTRARRAGTC